MGAYLSKPRTGKETSSGSNEWVSYGCSSMQGWRRFQEDAHNCILDFDPKRTASLFAVYDGHGGSEVAKYCSSRLPQFILSQPKYATEDEPINPASILKKAFIDFDVSLTQTKVKLELKEIANPDNDADTVELSPQDSDDSKEDSEEGTEKKKVKGKKRFDHEDDDRGLAFSLTEESVDELSELNDEATRPIEVVLRKQFSGEIPNYIQTLLSTIRPKIGDASAAGPSTSSVTSDEPTTVNQASDKEPVSTDSKSDEVKTISPDQKTSEENIITITGEEEMGEEEGKDLEKGERVDSIASVSITQVNEDEDEDDEDDEDFEVDDEEDDEEDEEEGVDYGEYDEDDEEEEEDENDEDRNSIGVIPRPVGFTEPGVDSGSTACVALLLPELGYRQDGEEQQSRVCLYVANAGDSRAVLCRAGAAVELSEDHKPEDPPEKARIQAAGGTVTADGRVNDGLNLSRAIGDHIYKRREDLKMSEQMISAMPDVTKTELIPSADEFMVIACDGIWNAMSSQAVVDFVYDRLHPESISTQPPSSTGQGDEEVPTTMQVKTEVEGKEDVGITDRSSPAFLARICEELFDACLAPNTMGDGTGCDNMTCIILRFDHLSELSKRAVTHTCDTVDYSDGEESEDIEGVEVDKIEVKDVLKSMKANVEGDHENSDEPHNPSVQSIPVPVANGNVGSDDIVAPKIPSPTLSPVPKKARMENSGQNGGGGETLSSAE